MDVATFEAHHEALSAFDASYENVYLSIGKYAGLSYTEVARTDAGYCGWVCGLVDPYGDIANFRRFAVRRHALEQPIKQLREDEHRNVQRQRAEQLQRASDERRALLELRKKTSRGQLVELTYDSDMFQSCITKRLPLLTLLALAGVCKGIHVATSGRPDWNLVVASAMAKRRASFSKKYDRVDRVRRHDRAVKCFFGLPSAMDIILGYDAVGLLCGFDEHMRAVSLIKANGPNSYSTVRNEIRLAINDRKKKLKVHETAIEEMSGTLVNTATKLSTADTRVKTAVSAMIAFLGEHKLKIQGVALAVSFVHTDVHVWEDFATKSAFARPATTTVAPSAKR